MRAYLINPFTRSITEVEYDGNYKSIYGLINAHCFDVARLDHGDGIYIDDEGLISGQPQQFFLVKGYPTPLAGKGLVLGSDDEGETTPPRITLDQLTSLITFLTDIEVLVGARMGRWS